MNNHKIIAVIPARGGSKRIHNKNIVDFCGKPLIAYTIGAAIESELFSRVVVSTDSEDIASISKKFGAEAPFLRTEYYDDHTPVSKATTQFVEQCEVHYQEKYNSVCQLMAVCPLRTSADIIDMFHFFTDKSADSVISCSPYPLMEVFWAHTLNDDFVPKPIFKEMLLSRSQDLKKAYCPSGAIWFADREKLKIEETFYGKSYHFYPMSWKHAIDIDTYEDLELAKLLYKNGVEND